MFRVFKLEYQFNSNTIFKERDENAKHIAMQYFFKVGGPRTACSGQ